MRIIVYTKSDYSENSEFELADNLPDNEIVKEVDKRYKEWYYFDVG